MENKKIMIPVILGVILLCGIVFTLVYKKTDGNISKEEVVQTLAQKETEPIEWTNMIFIFLLSYLNISYINATHAYKGVLYFLCLSWIKSLFC